MKRAALQIDLLDDCVFSARAATEGGHASLTHVPGSALLGAAAARVYRTLSLADAARVFHSGTLRFGNGLPWDGHSVGYPLPLSWHQPKESLRSGDDLEGCLSSPQICNYVHGKHGAAGAADLQFKPMRDGYVHADGRLSKPAHGLRMKTAIDPATGRAMEAALFGYDALQRGQSFVACIDADDDLDADLFERVLDALHGPLLLGRSRSAEFGRAQARRIELPPLEHTAPPDATRVTLWLLSDLAPCDRARQPTHAIDPMALGFPQGSVVDASRTFVRQRRYSPWNAVRHGYERERLVLHAGGVITVILPDRADRGALLQRLRAGLGLHRESGLGQVWADAPLLADRNPRFGERKAAMPKPDPVKPEHPLLHWLTRQDESWKIRIEREAEEKVCAIGNQIMAARHAAGIDTALPFGPSRSQWGRVFEAARESSGAALYDLLFNGDKAIIKANGEGWSIEVSQNGRWQPLAVWLKEQLQVASRPSRDYAHWIRRVAHRMRDDIDNRRV